MRKFKNILEFYKTTIAINSAISMLALWLGGISEFFIVFSSFGFIISCVFKEIFNKDEYLFYYNNRISKIYLLLYSFVLNFIFSLLLISIFHIL